MSELDIYNALLVFTLLNVLDIITTYNVVRRAGSVAEANPIARWFIERLGVAGLFILKYFAMGFIVAIGILQNALAESVWVNNVILALVVAWNSYQNYRLRSKP